MLTPEKINWNLTGHISQSGQSIRAYQDDQHGLEKEVVARVNAAGIPTGNVKTYFFINDDKREFRSEQALCDAYNKLNSITQ